VDPSERILASTHYTHLDEKTRSNESEKQKKETKMGSNTERWNDTEKAEGYLELREAMFGAQGGADPGVQEHVTHLDIRGRKAQ
jgi:hypothetical protein